MYLVRTPHLTVFCLATALVASCLFANSYAANPTIDHSGPYSQGADTTHAIDPAIANDDASILGWVTGHLNYYRSDGDTNYADPTAAYGNPAGTFGVVSLGDLNAAQILNGDPVGEITLTFDIPIGNDVGHDFAVFENGFAADYCELAYVEVSTDGVEFVRFESYYNYATAPIGGYSYLDATKVYNLAGKHAGNFGTPFDLEELVDNTKVVNGLVDLNDINYIRLIDIPGDGSFLDSEGRGIYDSWVTWGSGGFDLDAACVLNTATSDLTVSLDCSDITQGATTSNSPLHFTITFSEPVVNLSASDITVSNGTADALTGTGTSWSFEVIPGALGEVSVQLGAAKCQSDTYGGKQNKASNTFSFTAITSDTTAPTATITPVSPNPRNTAVNSVEIVFSETVSHVDVNDFTLTCNGGTNLLTGAETLSSTDNITFTLDVSALTTTDGAYVFDVAVSDITDTVGNPLDASAQSSWTMTTTAPEPTILPVSTPAYTAVTSIGIRFEEAVQNFTLDNLTLSYEGGANLLTAAQTLTSSDGGKNWSLGIGGLTNTQGAYTLTLLPNGIVDLAGNAVTVGDTLSWSKTLAVVGENGYTIDEYYANPHISNFTLVSFDWDNNGALYYSTGNYSAEAFSVYQYDGGVPNAIYSQPGLFPGSRVTRIGSQIYFNDGGDYSRMSYNGFRYDPATGGAAVAVWDDTNPVYDWGLNTYNGETDILYAGADGWGPTSLYYATLDANGDFTSFPAIHLGEIGGSSGPVAADTQGNLFYADGYASPPCIYRWTAAEVTAVIQAPALNSLLPDGHTWATIEGAASGATGMVVDGAGNVYLSATSWTAPSELRVYHNDPCTGNYTDYEVIATYTGRMETVRLRDGKVFVSCDQGIYSSNLTPQVCYTRVIDTPAEDAETVTFEIAFTEPVSGFASDLSDFELITQVTATMVQTPYLIADSLSTTDNTVYTVEVNTGIFEGTLSLNVGAGGAIVDADGAAIADDFVACDTFTVDTLVPLLVSPVGETHKTVTENDTVSFEVLATGISGTVSYQWFKKGESNKAADTAVGEDSSTFTLDSVQLEDAGSYYCRVSDAAETVDSALFTLEVLACVPVKNTLTLVILTLSLSLLGVAAMRKRHAAKQ